MRTLKSAKAFPYEENCTVFMFSWSDDLKDFVPISHDDRHVREIGLRYLDNILRSLGCSFDDLTRGRLTLDDLVGREQRGRRSSW